MHFNILFLNIICKSVLKLSLILKCMFLPNVYILILPILFKNLSVSTLERTLITIDNKSCVKEKIQQYFCQVKVFFFFDILMW